MVVVFIITTNNPEKVYNAMRLANVAVSKGDEVNVFMLGEAVLFEQIKDERFNVMEQINQYKGNMYF
jgi:uncharacterized protein involved in oxidation of intracellular sulfur